MKNTNKPVLSINLIFRNDIRCIEKCLKALGPLRKALPCELVMADTGSTDGSREIAEKYADVVFDFPWIDDFAAARNAVLERSSGEWCFILDTDEYLDPDISEMITFFTKSKNRYTGVRAAVTIYNYFDREMQGEYVQSFPTRLVRMDTGIRYAGIIHESLDFGELESNPLLMFHHILLRHDGYAYTSPEARIAKEKRNLALLEKTLDTDSNKYRRILQCLESSTTCNAEIRERYVRMAFDLETPTSNDLTVWHIPVLRSAIMVAHDLKLSEIWDWIKKIRELYPDSLYTRVDVTFVALSLYYQEKDWAHVLEETKRYHAGLTDFDNGNYRFAEYVANSLQGILPRYRSNTAVMEAVAAANIADWSWVKRALKNFDAQACSPSCELDFWKAIQNSWQYVDLQPIVEKTWKQLNQKLKGEEVYEQLQIKRSAFVQGAINCFLVQKNEVPPFSLIALLEGSDVALAAQIMLEEQPERISQLLKEIQDWLRIPVVVIIKAMRSHVALPEPFFQLPAEVMQRIIALLPKVSESFTQEAVAYCHYLHSETPAERLMQVNLVTNAILGETWENFETSFALTQCFFNIEKKYLEGVYQPNLLTEMNINTLPELHRFGFYFLQAEEMLKAGDEAGYVKLLRKGLDTTPVMKNMVDFICKHLNEYSELKKLSTNKELIEMAKQLKAKLEAMRKSGLPGIETLESSPIFQKLKPIMESF